MSALLQRHTAILALLDVTVPGPRLPTLVKCPLCGRPSLLVQEDLQYTVEWASCQSCKFSGDLILLAATKWKTSITEAVGRIFATGAPLPHELMTVDGLSKWEYRVNVKNPKLLKFFSNASKRLKTTTSPDIAKLIRSLNIRLGVPAGHWVTGIGRLIGCTDIDELSDAVGDHPKGKNRRPPEFSGRGWGELLIVPYQDALNRISGFSVVGREGAPSDFVFLQLNKNPTGAGIAWMDVVVWSNQSKVLVTTEEWFMLQMQSRLLRLDLTPHSVVCWKERSGVGRELWAPIAHKELIFWDAVPTATMFANACLMNARVTLHNAFAVDETVTLKHFTEHARMIYNILLRENWHWSEALLKYLNSIEPSRAGDLAHQLREIPEVREIIEHECGESIWNRYEPLNVIERASIYQTVAYHEASFTEIGDRWFRRRRIGGTLAKNQTLVSDAILEIHEIIRIRNKPQRYYRGKIRAFGQSTDYFEDAEVVHNDPKSFVRKQLRQIGVERCMFGSCPESLIDIALMFRKPREVIEDDRVGWSEAKKSYLFPKFQIGLIGDLRPIHLLASGPLPCQDFSIPRELSPVEARTLLLNAPAETALAGAILDIGVRNMYKQTPCGVVLSSVADVFSKVALDCGCVEVPGLHMLEGPSSFEKDHDWPVLVRDNLSRRQASTELLTHNRRPLVIKADFVTARIAHLLGAWHLVAEGPTAGIDHITLETLPAAILSYLHASMSRAPWKQGKSARQDFSNWLLELSDFDAKDVPMARGCEDLAAQRRSFNELVEYALKSGAIINGIDLDKESQRLSVFIPEKILKAPTSSPAGLVLPESKLLEVLETEVDGSVILKRQTVRNGKPGFIVDRNWWIARVRQEATAQLEAPYKMTSRKVKACNR